MSPEQYITIILIALGLAMDCFAVSIARGIKAKKNRLGNAVLLALSFGLFQALMPVIGWYAGETIIGFIEKLDHWIAFILLAAIGLKMIGESGEEDSVDGGELTIPLLLTLSIATSIDALAVGFTIAFLNMPIMLAASIIGVASFMMSILGFYIGRKSGKAFGKRMEILGGIILMGIGLKILLEHLL